MTLDDAVLNELRAQTPWIRLQGLRILVPLLQEHLRSNDERVAYEMSDGKSTTRDIGRAIRKDHSTVARWWSRWAALGVVTVSANGRAAHLMSLTDLGIDVALPRGTQAEPLGQEAPTVGESK